MLCAKLRNFIAVGCFFLINTLSADLGHLNLQNDHQFWFEAVVHQKICKDVSLTLTTINDWGNDYSKYFFNYQAIGMEFDVMDKLLGKIDKKESLLKGVFFTVELARRNTIAPSFPINKGGVVVSEVKWVTHNIPAIWALFFFGWRDWNYTLRTRLDYACPESSHYGYSTQFRLLQNLHSPWKYTKFKINPFIYNEGFYRGTNRNVGGLFDNRFRIGVQMSYAPLGKFFEDVKADIYWQWRAIKQPIVAPRAYFYTYAIGILIVKGIP